MKKFSFYIERARARRSAKRIGRRMPNEETVKNIAAGVMRKTAYSNDKVFASIRRGGFFGEFIKTMRNMEKEVRPERFKLANKIAANYALSAIGLSVIYDREIRDRVQSVLQTGLEAVERSFQITKNPGKNTVLNIERKLYAELVSILGIKKTNLFLAIFYEKLVPLSIRINAMPIMVK